METEAQLIVQRASLRWLAQRYPNWTQPDLATALGSPVRACELLLGGGSGKQKVESSAGMVGKRATRSGNVRRS